MKKNHRDRGIVYSTEHGKMCPECNNALQNCSCNKQQSTLPGDGFVRLARETKGRKGKGVTLISGIPLEPNDLKKLAKSLKQQCGSGGSIKNGVIEVQGDHRDLLEKELSGLGYKIKRVGG